MNKLGHVYIVDNGLGNVKIGRTINPQKRLRDIETQSGIVARNSYLSPMCSNYRELETIAHDKFRNYWLIGEWFKIDFVTAKNFLSTCNFQINNEISEVEPEFNIFSKEIAILKIGNYITDLINAKMDSLILEINIYKGIHGAIPNELKQKALNIIKTSEHCETHVENQISVLIDFGNDYKAIKAILEKKYLMSA
ncbi:GIY-YIG nuclease family protein [Clostridium sp. BJN0013]|uniref:GIY-YIG nuclease family protein n=1 Tax=Clostridium sp. BJN0013 TaxID=3236840 RepID=UPI0034C657BD